MSLIEIQHSDSNLSVWTKSSCFRGLFLPMLFLFSLFMLEALNGVLW